MFVNGENSGRNEVAKIFSRLFPSRCRSIDGVAPRYPGGPYPTDRTVRRGRAEVDYTTPPHHDGMGTFSSRLAPGTGPIEEAAILVRSGGVDSVVLLNIHLPPHLRALAPAILDAERRVQVIQAQ